MRRTTRIRVPWGMIAGVWLAACSGSHDDELGNDGTSMDGSIAGDGAAGDPPSDAALGHDAASDGDSSGDGDGGRGQGDGDAGSSDAGGDASSEIPRNKIVWVNASSGSDGNAGTSEAPFKTVAYAFSQVGEHGLVWLQPSAFTNANEGFQGTEIYDGVHAPLDTFVRGTGPGVTVGITLNYAQGGSLEDVAVELAETGRVLVTGGALRLLGVSFQRSATSGVLDPIEVSGDAKVTLEPGNDPNHDYIGPGAAPVGTFAMLRDASEFAVKGGVIDGFSGRAFYLDGTARLTLQNVAITDNANMLVSNEGVLSLNSKASHILLEDTTLDMQNHGGAACIIQDDQVFDADPTTTTITVRRSKLKGCWGGGMQLREGDPVVVVEDSEFSQSTGRYGIESGQIGFDSGQVFGKPKLTVTGSTFSNNYMGGIAMRSGGSLSLSGGTVTANGRTGFPGDAGVLLTGGFPYALAMRGVSVTNNFMSGVSVSGDGSASFDLGTLASPGNNVLTGNATQQLRLETAADSVVPAIGNTWTASQQGAGADGRYAVSSAHCGNANPCQFTSGTGINYAFVGAGTNARVQLAAQ
ncbi:MAG: right-handed parallel beta-helix repeat-containing protein [Myxococcales bacterium]